jgi:hypothetical protein
LSWQWDNMPNLGSVRKTPPRDLGTYRREIKDVLLTLQIFPIEESNFALAYGPLVVMLRDLIGRCDAVIHLAGFY